MKGAGSRTDIAEQMADFQKYLKHQDKNKTQASAKEKKAEEIKSNISFLLSYVYSNITYTGIQEKNQCLTEADQEISEDSNPRPGKKAKKTTSILSDEENDFLDELDNTMPTTWVTGASSDENLEQDDLPQIDSEHEVDVTQDSTKVLDHGPESFMTNGI